MTSWHEILVREAEKRLGAPATATGPWTPEQLLMAGVNDLQIVYPLAWLYAAPAAEFPANPWRGHAGLLAALETLFENALSAPISRRNWYPLFHALRLTRPALGARTADWVRRFRAAFFEQLWPELTRRERLTVLSSANVGYGTNHLAVEVSALTAFIAVFRGDADFNTPMQAGVAATAGPALIHAAESWLARFFAYQTPDGFWPECDGPADSYNTLTAAALLRAAADLDCVERYRAQFVRAARYGALCTLPDGSGMEFSNGRTQFQAGFGAAIRKCYAGVLAAGKILRDGAMAAWLRDSAGPERLKGEGLLECLCNILFQRFDDPAPAVSIWAPAEVACDLPAGLHYHKRGPWISGASTFHSMPRPEGHWNLDYQNLLTLYHCDCGRVLLGANGKQDLPAATFHKIFSAADGMVVRNAADLEKGLPFRGRFERTAQGWKLWREYRGFEGRLELTIVSDREATLEIQADARLDQYPITCTLLPALGHGHGFTDGGGRQRTVSADAWQRTGAELSGALVLTQPARPVRIALPADAVLRWPYFLWDPYNLKTDRYEKPEDGLALLDLPIGPAGVTLRFTVG